MKIGIFGGTFAPIHNGHVKIAKSALHQLALDKLIIMPNGLPPHKETTISKYDRLKTTQLAFEGMPNTIVSDYEITQQGANYSYKTLQYLKTIYPNDQLFFVVGGDSLRDFQWWRNPQEILDMATLVVATRGQNNQTYVTNLYQLFPNAKVICLDFEPMEISSTQIRLNYRLGLSNDMVVPQKVNQYILDNNLFADSVNKVKKLKDMLIEKRFLHTISVVEAGLDFARKNGISEEKAFLACLLHDCAKNLTVDQWQNYDFTNEENLLPPILHSGLGVKVAQKDFGVKDEEILDAIRYHTTAKPEMSPLAKLVFVADKAEKTRKYDTTNYYQTALYDLNKAFKMVLYDMFQIAQNKYGIQNVDKTTLSALKYYKMI
ncbi:MAG: nicotinate (nicotinamide) nucleotide adenylyltransferase [Clostridia bacterium]|nr:nicotinate (nicotinamide) nucleotide adenylyltransferase [Clostridia bacterium]